MREVADAGRIRRFMRELGRAAEVAASCYFTGGATAVLVGWRPTTIDVDVRFEPEADELLRAIQDLKDELRINVELASPAEFIPVPAGWQERSPFVSREGSVTFRHFDLYAQVLSKLERAHEQDLADVQALLQLGLVVPERGLAYFEQIEPELYRFPAVDAKSFRKRVEAAFRR